MLLPLIRAAKYINEEGEQMFDLLFQDMYKVVYNRSLGEATIMHPEGPAGKFVADWCDQDIVVLQLIEALVQKTRKFMNGPLQEWK